MKLTRIILPFIFFMHLIAPAHSQSRVLDLAPAKWIWYPSERTLQNSFILFRKEINIDQEVSLAKGWIFADSRYQLYVNGQRVQWGPAPSDPRWQEVDPVDLTKYLKKGKNVIACQVLFYGVGDGTWPIGVPGFIFKLDVDGKELVSDRTWKSCLARSWAPGQYKRWYLRTLQEDFDARLYPEDWNDAAFVENVEWLNATELPGSPDKSSISAGYPEYLFGTKGNNDTELRERSIPLMLENEVEVKQLTEAFRISWKQPVENYFDMLVPGAYKTEKMEPHPAFKEGSVTVDPEGDKAALLTFEFAEQSVGFPCFTIDAPEGTIIEMLVHEAHKPGNEVIFNSHFNAWTRFTCKEGVNTFKTFDYESLRWMQLHIRNFDRPVRIAQVGMLRRSYDFAVTPRIRVSDPDLQRLFEANVNTMYNSCQDIVVDGMARERQQYSGDGGHQLHPLFQMFGETRLSARFVNTFGQGLTKDGYFLDCWPAYDRLARMFERQMDMTQWGPLLDHGVGFCFDAWHYYLYTGRKEDIGETYPRLLRFFNYLQSIEDQQDGLLKVEDIGIPWVWMDHMAYSPSRQREKQLAFNLYTAAMCEHALSPLCLAFGDEELSKEIAAYGEGLRNSCIKKYWDPEEKVFVDNLPWLKETGQKRYSDRALATAVLFDQCPGNEEERSVGLLVERPENLGISYPCNAVWRLWALAGQHEMPAVLKELREKWSPMNSVLENNTIAEFWDADYNCGHQWSHAAMAPLVMLYQGLIGAKPLTPGGTRYSLCPQPVDLSLIDTDIQTPQGAIHFKSEGLFGKRKIEITVPEDMEIELWLHKDEKVDFPVIGEGDHDLVRYLVKGGESLVLKLKHT